MGVIASVTISAFSFLVLITQDGFEFVVDFNMLIEAIFLLFTVAFEEVLALESLIAWMVGIGVEFLCIVFPAH